MADTKEYPTNFNGFAVPALVIAFVVQPALARFSSERLYILGSILLAMVFITERFVFPATSVRRRVAIAGPTTLIALGVGLWYLTPEQENNVANDKRCLAIQQDMLSAHPLRSDGPDLFQALGCRPQGEGSVHAPPSEAMIEVHEWLPWGGVR